MYVLGLSGSPRRHANSESLLDEVLLGAAAAGAETEKLIASRFRKLLPCVNCGHCLKTGRCIVDDEMQEVYPKLEAADALVVASPIYFMNVSAFLKILIDRCQCYWSRKYVLKEPLFPDDPGRIRKGLFLATSGHDKPVVFKGARMTVKSMFDVLEVEYFDEYFAVSIENPGDVWKMPGAAETVHALGGRLVRALQEGRQ